MGLERKMAPLLPRALFIRRQARYSLFAAGIVAVSLAIGVVGYRFFCDLPWIEALLNASFILTGMGPVDPMLTIGGKLFASGYAIFSGVAFLTTIGVVMTPIAHRFLHRFHLVDDENQRPERR
jgi:hypothetical protein